jgi:hypothetical protein
VNAAIKAAETCIDDLRDEGDHAAAYEEACRTADAAFDESRKLHP